MTDNMKTFRKGGRYYSFTRQGKITEFVVTKVMKNANTGIHTAVYAVYGNRPERRYEVKHGSSGNEYVIADERYCTVITPDELNESKEA